MNFVPCLAWVSKGIAKSRPDRLQLSPEELKKLIEETKNSVYDNEIEEEEKSDISATEEGNCSVLYENKTNNETKKKETDLSASEDEDETTADIKEELASDNNEDDFGINNETKKKETDLSTSEDETTADIKEEPTSDNNEDDFGVNNETKKKKTGLSTSEGKDKTTADIKEEPTSDNNEEDFGVNNETKKKETDLSASEDEDEIKADVKEEPASDDDEDFDSRYNMDEYDDEDDERPFMNITDVATFVDNKEDDYITDYDAVNEDEKEDEEDFIIKDSDNLLVTGHVEEESSVLEVHIYNKEEGTFYIHHDIVLPAYPLALEWLDFHPSDETPGNYIAVGDMTPVIKIWDLDVVEILEPDYCLGEKLKSKKKDGEKLKLKYHKDAVISLSWNKHLRNILASGSADSSIIIWDLQEGTALNKLKFHSNKVQSLQWHPFESSFLLSSCTDGLIKIYDCRAPDAECKSWTVDGEIEKITWNLLDSLKFFCSTDTGFVHSFDMRKTEIEHSTKAHNDGVTALDMCLQHPNILLTGSMDKTIKLWNIENGFQLIKSQKLKVGSIYTAKFAPDSELPVAVGGNNPSTSLKIIDLADVVGIKKETEEVSPDSNLETNSSTDTRPPKKMKFSKSCSSQKFNQSASTKKNSQEPQQVVKRIHKKY